MWGVGQRGQRDLVASNGVCGGRGVDHMGSRASAVTCGVGMEGGVGRVGENNQQRKQENPKHESAWEGWVWWVCGGGGGQPKDQWPRRNKGREAK